MKKVIIIGYDDTNTLGLIHSFGKTDIHTIVFLWEKKTGIVPSSSYVDKIHSFSSVQGCINLMIEKYGDSKEKIVILTGCDVAVVALSNNVSKMPDCFVFERAKYKPIPQLQEKNLQVLLAKEAGFNVPESKVVQSVDDIPSDFFSMFDKTISQC